MSFSSFPSARKVNIVRNPHEKEKKNKNVLFQNENLFLFLKVSWTWHSIKEFFNASSLMMFLLNSSRLLQFFSDFSAEKCGNEVLSSFVFHVEGGIFKLQNSILLLSHMFLCNFLIITQIKSQVAAMHV